MAHSPTSRWGYIATEGRAARCVAPPRWHWGSLPCRGMRRSHSLLHIWIGAGYPGIRAPLVKRECARGPSPTLDSTIVLLAVLSCCPVAQAQVYGGVITHTALSQLRRVSRAIPGIRRRCFVLAVALGCAAAGRARPIPIIVGIVWRQPVRIWGQAGSRIVFPPKAASRRCHTIRIYVHSRFAYSHGGNTRGESVVLHIVWQRLRWCED